MTQRPKIHALLAALWSAALWRVTKNIIIIIIIIIPKQGRRINEKRKSRGRCHSKETERVYHGRGRGEMPEEKLKNHSC